MVSKSYNVLCCQLKLKHKLKQTLLSNRSTKVDNRPESKCYNRRKQEALERLNQETNGVNDRIQAALANQNVTDEK